MRLIWLLILITVIGCQNVKEDDTFKVASASSRIISKDKPTVKLQLAGDLPKMPLDSIFGNISYVYLEGSPESDIGQIDEIAIADGHIVIMDAKVSKCLFVYDINGKFLYKIRQNGEMETPKAINIFNHQIYIADISGKLFVHDLKTGNLMNKITLPFYVSSFKPDPTKPNSFNFYTASSPSNPAHSYWLMNVDVKKKEIAIKDFPQTKTDPSPRTIFNMAVYSTDTYFIKNLNDTIFKINGNSISPFMELDFGARTLPAKVRDSIVRSPTTGFYRLLKADYVSGIKAIFVTKDWFFFSYGLKEARNFVYFNRKTNKKLEFRSLLDNRFMGVLNQHPMGVYKDQFVYFTTPRTFKSRLLHQQKSSTKFKITPEMQEMIKRLGNNNNPVLIFATPKS